MDVGFGMLNFPADTLDKGTRRRKVHKATRREEEVDCTTVTPSLTASLSSPPSGSAWALCQQAQITADFKLLKSGARLGTSARLSNIATITSTHGRHCLASTTRKFTLTAGPIPNTDPSNDRVMSTLDNAIGAINIVTELVPFELAKGVLSTVSGILILVKTTISNQNDFLELAEQCHKITLLIWRATTGVPESDISPAIRRALSELNKSVNGIRQGVDERIRKRLTSKVFHVTVNQDMIAGWQKDLDRFLALFNTELNIAANLKLDELVSLFEELRANVQFKAETLISDVLPVRPPIFMGRDALVRETVEFLLEARHVALIGPGGMGKTSIAQAVINEDSMSAKFSDRRYFVRYDDVDASQITHATFLDRIARSLGISCSKANTRNLILNELSSSKDLLLVLDNAETFLDAAVDSSLITNSIDEFGARPNVQLMLTTRTSGLPPNLAWERLRVPALDESAACAAFKAIYLRPIEPSILSQLLSALDFHPLSINLLAQAAVQNEWSLEELVLAWDRQKALLLENGDGKFHSIATTIEMSLNSPSLQKLGGVIRDLLQLIAFLPQGLNEARLTDTFPSITKIEHLANTLCKHSLAYRKSGFITMLAPIRLYISSQHNTTSYPAIPLLDHLQAFYDAQLEDSSDEETFIREEDVNVEHVIALRIAHCDAKAVEYACIQGRLFLVSLMQHKPRATALYPVIKEVKCDEVQTNSVLCFPISHRRTKANLVAKVSCLLVLSVLQIEVGQFAEAQEVLNATHKLSVICGSKRYTRLAECAIAEAYASVGNYIVAESMYESAMKRQTHSFFKTEEDRQIDACIYRGLGVVRMLRGKPGASEFFVRGLPLLQRLGDTKGVRQMKCVAGYAELLAGNNDKARESFESAMENYEEDDDYQLHVTVLMSMVEVAHRQGNTKDAKEFRDRLGGVFQRADINSPYAISGRAILAAHTALEGNIAQAREEIYSLVESATKSINTNVVNSFYLAGCIELLDNNFVKAAEMFQQTIDFCKTFSEYYFCARAERALGEIAVLDKDFASANARFTEAKALCDFMGVPTNCLYYDHACYTLSDRFEGWTLFQEGRLTAS
ncbi:hypothetical protein D9615_010312 [Tricholomella constricta]|uniref:AAA+ ATPase domain-containing protein n=1 Tax=Tricholomella constricta TaxID=117010 RepID=A0A8H5GPH4_9AGAR|nr:hypothetical protein D9615_010312 [Tricholomella constricta]